MHKAGTPRIICAVVVLLLALTPVIQIHAQVAGGTLSGTVTDPSGGIVPQADIVVRSVATGVTRTVTSDSAGLYAVPNLLPGGYEVTVTASGFAKEVQKGVTISVGAQQELNIKLQIGEVSQTVEVSEQAPQIQLQSSSLMATVNDTAVRELPLNGRSWTDLATLQPGVTNMSAEQPQIAGSSSASARGIRGFGNQFAISGGRPGQNNYRLNGISENDYSNSSPGSVTGGAAGVDAIAEFSVIITNYSAEYGRTSGGVINAITRGGANGFHGDVYEFIRNSSFDAKNYFDSKAKSIPPFRRNQFGASLGGPIIHDKTFFFTNYEGLRQSLGTTFKDNVPSTNADQGILNFSNASQFPTGTNPCVANGVSGTINNQPFVQCVLTVSPNITPFLPLWHAPNAGLLGLGNTGVYTFAAQQVVAENFGAARIDHRFSESDNLAGSFQMDRAQGTLPDPLNTVVVAQQTGQTFIVLEENHTFSSSLVNSARLGYNRSAAFTGGGISAINPAAQGAATSVIPGFDAPLIQPTGITFFGGGVNNQSFAKFAWNSYQFYDDVFFTKGKNTFKFGFAVERMQDNYRQQARAGGLVGFGSIQNMLLDIASKFQLTFAAGIQPRGLRQSLFGGYAQDDYRLLPNLVLNLGVRYEMTTAPSEVKGLLGRLLTPTSTTVTTGNPFFGNPTLHNFEPRVGFAWDPFKNGKTSVRGGFGLFDILPLAYEYSNFANNSAPFAPQGNVNNLSAGQFPAQAVTLATNPGALRVSYVEPNPKRNYVEQWNFSIQRQLAANLTVTVAYVGNHGVHMEFRADDMNAGQPIATSPGVLYPTCGPNGKPGVTCAIGFFPTGTTANPIKNILNGTFGRIDNTNWGNDNSYNGLSVLVEQRFSHGFQIQGSYTWSKTIDEGSGSYLSDPFNNSISNLFSVSKKLRRSVADYDITHNASLNYSWIIPGPKSLPAAASFALNGWQVGGILSVRSGLPFSPIIGGDPLGLNTDDFEFPNRIKTGACASATTGNPNAYLNLTCFSLPTPIAGITAAQCTPFGVHTDGTGGIAGTCENLVGNGGRNSVRGPGLVDLDFSVFKNNYIPKISEAFNIQFRAEIFNIPNHPNFLSPTSNNAVFDVNGNAVGGAGLIAATSTTSRQVQFGLKVIF
jgi:hypothetical protein